MFAKYIQEDSKGDDDEDVALSLSSARIIEWEAGLSLLLSNHQTVGNGIFDYEEWDEAELVDHDRFAEISPLYCYIRSR